MRNLEKGAKARQFVVRAWVSFSDVEARKRLFCGERLIQIKLRLTPGPDTIIDGGSKHLFRLDLADDSTLIKRSPRRHERESLASEQSEEREGAQRMNRIDLCWLLSISVLKRALLLALPDLFLCYPPIR